MTAKPAPVMSVGPVGIYEGVAEGRYYWRCEEHRKAVTSAPMARKVCIEAAQAHEAAAHKSWGQQGKLGL